MYQIIAPTDTALTTGPMIGITDSILPYDLAAMVRSYCTDDFSGDIHVETLSGQSRIHVSADPAAGYPHALILVVDHGMDAVAL